jgi:hypothetical protein
MAATDFRLEIAGEVFPAIDEMAFLSNLTGFIQANSAVQSFLSFAVHEGVTLAEAVLRVGSPPDRIASLPLTGAVPEPVYPLELDVSGSAEGVGPTNPGTVVFTLLGASLHEDKPHEHSTSPTGHRANADELFLVLHVRAEKASGGPDLLGTGAFRLVVDGVPQAPWDSAGHPAGSAGSPQLAAGAAVDAWVAFLIPTSATELALQVGRFDQDPGLIPVNLPPLEDG